MSHQSDNVDAPDPGSGGDGLSPRMRTFSLLIGLAAFFGILLAPTPDSLTIEGQRLAAVTALMALYWVLQPIPIAATSLIPMALYPLMGILAAPDVCRVYADPNVFLYLGGFMIAIAIERWNLHRRIALHVISFVGSSPRRIIFGFMLTTALLSMWISNTASSLLMLPIGLALVSTLQDALKETNPFEADRVAGKMTVPLLLGIAYAASIGGVATLIGTPTNLSLRGFWERIYVPQGYSPLSFAEWMVMFFPLALLMLIAAAVVMTWNLKPFPQSEQLSRSFFRDRLKQLGKPSGAEWRVLAVFTITALLWILREPLIIGDWTLLPSWPGMVATVTARFGVTTDYLTETIHDSTIGVAMALILFVLPGEKDASGERPRLLNWNIAERNIPWGMLLLFGGGFTMAEAFKATALSDWVGARFSDVFAGQSLIVLVLGVCFLLTFLTEFTSNTATINTLLPILGAMAVELSLDPRWLAIPATVSASFAFMFPVGTPPNAIIFGSGKVPMQAMIRYGFVLNLLGALFTALFMRFLGPSVLHVPLP